MSTVSPESAPGYRLADTSQPIGVLSDEETKLLSRVLDQPIKPHPTFFAIFGGGYFVLFGYLHLRGSSVKASLLFALAMPLTGLLLLVLLMAAGRRQRKHLSGKQLEKMSITGVLSFGKPSIGPVFSSAIDVTNFAVGGHVFKDLPKDGSLNAAITTYKFKELIGAYENQTIKIDYGKDFPLTPLQIYTSDGTKVYDVLSDGAVTPVVNVSSD